MMKLLHSGKLFFVLLALLVPGCSAPVRHIYKPKINTLSLKSNYKSVSVRLQTQPDSLIDASEVRWNDCEMKVLAKDGRSLVFPLVDVAEVTALRKPPGFWYYAAANAIGLYLGVSFGLELAMNHQRPDSQGNYPQQSSGELLFPGALLSTLIATNMLVATSSRKVVYTFSKTTPL